MLFVLCIHSGTQDFSRLSEHILHWLVFIVTFPTILELLTLYVQLLASYSDATLFCSPNKIIYILTFLKQQKYWSLISATWLSRP